MSINILGRIVRAFSKLGGRAAPRQVDARPPIVRLKSSPALRIAVHARFDRYVSAKIAETGEWEPFETELVQRFLRPGDGFIDIGANIGWYTIIAASRVGSQGRVYAFEPGRENFELATRNIALNGFRNVTLERVAISDRPGSARLFLSNENLGDHRLFESAEERPSETVEVTTLDRYFANRPGSIRVIKMDTQGSEAKIFEGITPEFVRERNVAAFLFEYWPRGLVESGSSAEALIRRFAALGLQCYVIQEEFRGLDPIDLAVLQERAHGDLRPETDRLANMFAMPASEPIPDWIREFIRSPGAPFFYPAYS